MTIASPFNTSKLNGKHLCSSSINIVVSLCVLATGLIASSALAQPVVYYAGSTGLSVPVAATTPLPVAATFGASGAISTDASGTITLGGTYQTVFASSTTRKGCLIQNPATATEIMSVKVGTMANPFTIAIGGSFSCDSPGGLVVTDAITATAATTTHAFAAVSQ